jgi:soluble lytic murein transglycosylase
LQKQKLPTSLHTPIQTLVRVLFVLLISTLLVSCGKPAIQNQASTQSVAATEVPTATITPTPLPTPTPTPEPEARLDKANQAFLDGDYKSAGQEYQNVIDFSQDASLKAQAQVKLARLAYLEGDSTKALDFFRQVVDSAADNDAVSEADIYLARIYSDLGRAEDAANAYQAYITLKPEPLAGYIYEAMGDEYTNANLNQQALDAYDQALKTHFVDQVTLKLKAAKSLIAIGNDPVALALLQEVYNTSSSEYTRAQANLLVGQIYLRQGDTQNAYARFMDSVNSYPRAYDTYSALVALVNDGVEVNELQRGMIDYYAGQYAIAADVLKSYMDKNQIHEGSAHYFRALALTNVEDYEGAIQEWDALIRDHPYDHFWPTAWDEKAYTQWYFLGKYELAAETLLTFIQSSPQDTLAPSLLFEAGRIYERNNQLDAAVAAWERLPAEYPDSEYSFMGIHFAGISRYRQGRYADALAYFQRALLLGGDSTEKAGAYFWMGKSADANGDNPTALTYWQNAMKQDPTGYCMFEPFIVSGADARGLMQMLPSTARETSSQSGWPPVFLDQDIYRPQISIYLGSYYLNQQIRLQDGDLYAGLAAYNAGPGNASGWKELAQGDPDLYLEVVRFKETRNYLRAILEIFNLYKGFYCR